MSFEQEWMGKRVWGVRLGVVWVKRGEPLESRMRTMAPGRRGVAPEVEVVMRVWREAIVEGERVGDMVGAWMGRLVGDRGR